VVLVGMTLVTVAVGFGGLIRSTGPHAGRAGNSIPAPTLSLPAATPAPTIDPLQYVYSFTETEPGGYTFSGSLSLGAPEQFARGEVQGDLTAGSACTIDPRTDAVVPGVLTLTNTSSTAAEGAVTLSWQGIGSFGGISAVEGNFSDGPACEGGDAGFDTGSLRVDSNPLQPGASMRLDLFVVAADLGNPNSVRGGLGELGDQLWLVSSIAPDTGSGITPTSLNGPGVSGTGSSDDPFTIPVGGD
jgi:hypothetical protein